jgi:hypothetical protein
MKYLKIAYHDILKRPSLYFFVFLIIFSIDRHHRFESSKKSDAPGPFYSDVFEYYTFLPDYFLDVRLMKELNPATNKRTIGMAILYSPAFFVGHAIAGLSGEVQNGYSEPYQWNVRWGSIIYCLIGLFFCRKNLLFFFKEPVVLLALICVFFGTNLFYYTYGWGELPHSYLFFLYSLFAWFTLKWIVQNKHFYLLPLGLVAGMIVLIRPTGVLVFLFPVLFNVVSFRDLFARIRYLFEKPLVLGGSVFLFMAPLIFQMLIWKKYSGHFIYYSYGEERFFFNDPQIVNFLFSFRKGWLVYTPIMVFSLAGIILSWKTLRSFFPFLLGYFTLTVYVLSSWWEWSYGGSFGCRALIESYAFLIFPFSVFVAWCWELEFSKFLKYGLRLTLVLIFYFCIELNIFQTWQYKYQLIHWSGMNKETYKYLFFRENVSREERQYLYTRFTPPDPEKMLKGERDQ